MALIIGLLILTYGSMVCLLETGTVENIPVSIRILRISTASVAGTACMVMILGTAGICNIWMILLVHLAAAAVVLRVRRPVQCLRIMTDHIQAVCRALRSVLRQMRSSPGFASGILIVLIQVIWCGAATWVMPPHAWDELAYHIPVCAGVVQTGSLTPLNLAYDCNHFLNGSTHLLYSWVAVIGRDSYLISGCHWLLWVLAGLSGYGLLRSLRVRAPLAGFLAAAATGCPIFIVQSLTAYVDISIAAYSAWALTFLVIWRSRKETLDFVLMVCSLGLLQGTKIHTFLFTAVFLAGFCVAVWSHGCRLVHRNTILILSAGILLGSYWIGARTIRFGNPVYPFEVRLGESVVFPGRWAMGSDQLTPRELPEFEKQILDDTRSDLAGKWIRILFSLLELGHVDNAVIHKLSGGYGQVFTVFLLPAGIAGLIRYARRTLWLWSILMGILLMPLSHVVRYTSMLPFVLLIPAALWLQPGRWRWCVPLAVLLPVTTAGLWFPEVMSNYGDVFLKGPVHEIQAGRLGLGLAFFGGAVLVSMVSCFLGSRHWPVFLFYPALIITLLTAGRYPLPSTVHGFLRNDHAEALDSAWKVLPLSDVEEELKQVNLAVHIHDGMTGEYAVVYSGDPYPPVTGLMFNRHFTNSVVWTGRRDEPFNISMHGGKTAQ